MGCKTGRRAVLAGASAAPFVIRRARAEVSRLRVARQFGIGYLQLALLEDSRLIEKFAADAGLGTVEVSWSTFRSSDVMNDALLSGSLDIASLGIPGLATIWDRTQGARFEVRGLVGLNAAEITLVTRDPAVTSIADYRPGMKIALPAVKVSNQAIYLQMAAAKQWGQAEYARLDPLTVSMSHPDAVAALLSGGEIANYFGAPPFSQRALKTPRVRRVTDLSEILGTICSFNVMGVPTRFAVENPRLVRAFLDALAAATESINRDKAAAAATYARMTNDRTPVAELVEVMDGAVTYTLDVRATLPVVRFMASIGTLKRTPAAWTDYMLPLANERPGS